MEIEFKGIKYNVNNFYSRVYFDEIIQSKILSLGDGIHLENSGFTVYKPSNSYSLSMLDKAKNIGRHWGIHLGYDCNCRCKTCPNSDLQKSTSSFQHSRMLGNALLNDTKRYIELFGDRLDAISYSGGEALKYMTKLTELVEYVKKLFPNMHQAVYTNGLLLTKSKILKLTGLGISEFVIKLDASDYSEDVINSIRLLARYAERVTVEIVSTKESYRYLSETNLLDKLVAAGVKQLNLKENQFLSTANFENYGLNEDIYQYTDCIGIILSPCASRVFTLSVIELAINKNLDIVINDCSNDTTHLQELMKDNLPRCFR